MEEEFQGGVCGGNWWNSSRNFFSSSPCLTAVNDLGSPGWLSPSLIVDVKTAKSFSGDSADSSDGGSSVVLQEARKPQLTANGNMPMDSSLKMMTDGWNQDLLNDSARSQENYSHMLQALNSSMNCGQRIADEEWTTTEFSADSSTNSFRRVNQGFYQEQHPSNSFTQCAAATSCLDLPPTSFPLSTASYGYTSSLLQTLFDTDSQPHHALLDSPDFGMNSTGLVVPTLSKASSMMRPSFPITQLAANNFQFSNNTPFWNATAASPPRDVRASFLPSSTPQILPSALTKARLNQPNFSSKHHNEKAGQAESAVKKGRSEPPLKRPRIETPSPLPTFKVRKEKLGDRVTALQQLVSPFGKTDTASVLHEAIEYIKLLHDQVTVLSTPYLKTGQPPLQRQQGHNKMNDQEETMKDLRSRGLCLVPISSTFPVATETTADFWTPTFGGSFR